MKYQKVWTNVLATAERYQIGNKDILRQIAKKVWSQAG